MKNITKLITLILVTTLLISMFTGCSSDELTLYQALDKTSSIRSMESLTGIRITFEAKGFPEEMQQVMDEISPTINSTAVNIHQKMIQNQEKTAAKAQIDMSVQTPGFPIHTGIWVDADLTAEKPVLKEIISLPQVFAGFMPPELQGKEYIVYDLTELLAETQDPEAASFFDGILRMSMETSKNFGLKLGEFFKKYTRQFDAGFPVITKNGTRVIEGEALPVYQLRLDDAAFKALVKTFLNDVLQNKEAITLMKEYMLLVTDITDAGSLSAGESGRDEDSRKAIEEGFQELEKNRPAFLDNANKVLDMLKDVKLLGEKGILIEYTVNRDGYVVSETGTLDLMLDVQAMGKALENLFTPAGIESVDAADQSPSAGAQSSDITGVLNVTLDYNSNLSRINEDIKIEFPETNDQNALSIADMVKEGTQVSNPLDEAGTDEDGMFDSSYIGIYLDGEPLEFDIDPVIVNDRVVAPVADIAEALGAEVSWNGETQTAAVIKGATKILVKRDSSTAVINGKEVALDADVTVADGSIIVPVRFICENLGAEVYWYGDERVVEIVSE